MKFKDIRAALATMLTLVTAMVMLTVNVQAEVVYHRGNTGEPETLDQHKTSTIYESNILRDLYEGLVVYDPKGKVIAGVAESWSVSDDGRIYTFKIRSNAKWSNGDAVSAEDFVFSLRRIMDPATASKYASVLYPIKNAETINKGKLAKEELGVRAVDAATLEISLESPTPYFVELLTHSTGLPLHAASVKQHGANFVKPANMVSNGPFTLAETVPNSHIKVVKNPAFHDAANVKIDTVMYYPTEDRGAAMRRFQAGELHSNNDAPTEQTKWMRENLGEQFRVAPYLGTYYYTVNTTKAPFSDPRVRRALSMAIDREFVADEIWGGTMVAGYSYIPPGIGNYGDPAYADYKTMSMLDREDKAKALLAEAGFSTEKPLKVELRYNTSENHKNTAVAIADMWKPLGVEVSLLNTDVKTHYAYLREKGDYDVARAGWIGDYSDPQNFLFLAESENTGLNYANYKNLEFDTLMDQAAAEINLEKRAGILLAAERIFMRDLPYIPILYYGSLSLVSSKLKGWEDNLQNVHASRWMSIGE